MKAKSQTLILSSANINRNWRLKAYGVDTTGKRINRLVGVAGLIALIGVEMLNKLLRRAVNCLMDVCHCKLRRGLKISFTRSKPHKSPTLAFFFVDVGISLIFQNKSNTRKI